MKVYEIALTLVRVLVLVDVIREFCRLIASCVTATVVFATVGPQFAAALHESLGTLVAQTTTLSMLASPLFAIVVNLIIFATAPRIARFATKFAGPADVAVAR